VFDFAPLGDVEMFYRFLWILQEQGVDLVPKKLAATQNM
jgi:hypothetical protein